MCWHDDATSRFSDERNHQWYLVYHRYLHVSRRSFSPVLWETFYKKVAENRNKLADLASTGNISVVTKISTAKKAVAKHIPTRDDIWNGTMWLCNNASQRYKGLKNFVYKLWWYSHVLERSCFCVIRFLFHAGTSFHRSSSRLLASSSFCQIHNHTEYTVYWTTLAKCHSNP